MLLDYLDEIGQGFVTTVTITALSALGALVLGTLLAAFRVSPVAPLRAAGLTYVEVVRNTPLPVLAVLFALGLPQVGLRFSFYTWAVIALAVYTAAFVCEALRSGVNAVAVGQGEAARALGLGFRETMTLVVLPQAFRTVVPPLGNVLIALTKNTAVAATVDVTDISNVTELILNDPVDALAARTGAALCYLILALPTGLLLGRVERKTAFAR